VITVLKEQVVLDKLDELVRAVKARRPNATNPGTKQTSGQPLLDKLDELIRTIKESRSNPTGPSMTPPGRRAERVERKLRAERDEILDALEGVQDALDESEYDEAQEILSGILDQYETEDEGAEDEK
jgi:hypothetical protein